MSAKEKRQPVPTFAFTTETPAGFIHLDLKYLPPLHRKRYYAYVAIDRATRFVHVEILPNRRAATAAAFLERFLKSFPLKVHTLLTDNGSEFTDRFAVDMKNKPKGQVFRRPSRRSGVRQSLHQTPLGTPLQTADQRHVERFNRRITEHLDKIPYNQAAPHRRFKDQEELSAYLMAFVSNYNRTRLRCLGYKAPLEALNNLTGHNTSAGMSG